MGWVKREDGSWLVFDDDLVSESSWEFVQGLKGGGDEHMSYLQFYRAKKGGI
jgi:ubiquitin carboxyl-terminal hydrolase 14